MKHFSNLLSADWLGSSESGSGDLEVNSLDSQLELPNFDYFL